MGEVWLAHDERIGRQVALKKLRSGRNDQQNRFLIEAQITGQLEHPSVVPLHDLGTDDAGQSFYVMKFIQGQRLCEAIADFHARKSRGDWTGDVEFVCLLQTFVSVCYAIAYAHSKGVMHRDIKPDNVMLGKFGETMILDWGLAKVIGQSEPPTDSSITVSSGDSTTTQDGAIVGTLTYISPEAAQGNADAVDRASDVYLLGGTLYEIMTGTPPRKGSSHYDLIELARNRRPMNPRKLDPHVPRALRSNMFEGHGVRKAGSVSNRGRAGRGRAAVSGRGGNRRVPRADSCACRSLAPPTSADDRPRPAGGWIVGSVRIRTIRRSPSSCLRIAKMRRARMATFDRLAEEAQFYAANTDTVSERVPYYDPRRASAAGEAALAIVAPWREGARPFPLPELRADLQSAQYNLLLVMAQASLRPEEDGTSAWRSSCCSIKRRPSKSPHVGTIFFAAVV